MIPDVSPILADCPWDHGNSLPRSGNSTNKLGSLGTLGFMSQWHRRSTWRCSCGCRGCLVTLAVGAVGGRSEAAVEEDQPAKLPTRQIAVLLTTFAAIVALLGILTVTYSM